MAPEKVLHSQGIGVADRYHVTCLQGNPGDHSSEGQLLSSAWLRGGITTYASIVKLKPISHGGAYLQRTGMRHPC